MQQVQIHVNDEFDEDMMEDLFFSCRIVPISDRVLITHDSEEISIMAPIQFTQMGAMKSANAAKISFAHQKYLCRLSEKKVRVQIKRLRKEDKKVGCKMSTALLEGVLHPNAEEFELQDVHFDAHVTSTEIEVDLPLIVGDQVILMLTLEEFGPNCSEGSVTQCQINIINDKVNLKLCKQLKHDQ
jgi:hypothetical protein